MGAVQVADFQLWAGFPSVAPQVVQVLGVVQVAAFQLWVWVEVVGLVGSVGLEESVGFKGSVGFVAGLDSGTVDAVVGSVVDSVDTVVEAVVGAVVGVSMDVLGLLGRLTSRPVPTPAPITRITAMLQRTACPQGFFKNSFITSHLRILLFSDLFAG